MPRYLFLIKNLNASTRSEHPSVRRKQLKRDAEVLLYRFPTTLYSMLCCLLIIVCHIQCFGYPFSVLVANPKNLFCTVANPARGLLSRERRKKKKKSGSTPPPPPTLLVRRK